MDAAQAAAKPGIAKPRIDLDRVIKRLDRLFRFVLGGEQKAAQGNCFGIARSQRQGGAQRVDSFASVAEAEFQLRDSSPPKAKFGGFGDCLPSEAERSLERSLADGFRLLVIRGGQQFGRGLRLNSRGVLLA